MPLVVTMRKGHDVFVGGRRVLCSEIHDSRTFEVLDDTGVTHRITEDAWVEVYPEVKFMAGVPKFQSEKVVRAMIAAPDLLDIVRGDLMKQHKDVV